MNTRDAVLARIVDLLHLKTSGDHLVRQAAHAELQWLRRRLHH